MRNPECKFLHRMPQKQLQLLQRQMFELVLATDMAHY
jgi:hypothetical protein